MDFCTSAPKTSHLDYHTCMPGPLWPTEALGVRSAGIALIAPDWRHARGRVDDRANFYWGAAGVIRFRNDGREKELRAGEILYYPPGHLMEPSTYPGRGQFCWMTLCGPLAAALLEHAGLRRDTPFAAADCPVPLFRQLLELLRHPAPEQAQRADAIAYEIILCAKQHHAEALPGKPGPAQQLKACIDANFTDHAFNVDALARNRQRHRTGVSRTFKAAYGLTPGAYILEKRLARAATLLQTQNWNLERIARASGFADPGYLSRCFRRRYGLAPGAFRRRRQLEPL